MLKHVQSYCDALLYPIFLEVDIFLEFETVRSSVKHIEFEFEFVK